MQTQARSTSATPESRPAMAAFATRILLTNKCRRLEAARALGAALKVAAERKKVTAPTIPALPLCSTTTRALHRARGSGARAFRCQTL
jgi:hypothetical protein